MFSISNLLSLITGSNINNPVFIIGAPRSGTSVLHWSLINSGHFWGSEESEFMLPLVKALPDIYKTGCQYEEHSFFIKENVSYEEFMKKIGMGIGSIYADRASGKRWIENTPGYVLGAKALTIMFPKAQFLFIVRDGRQTVHSMRQKFGYTMQEAVKVWVNHVKYGVDFLEEFPNKVMHVCYEELVKQHEQSFRAIFKFLGVKYSQQSINFFTDKPINISPNTENETSVDKLKPKWQSWSEDDHALFNEKAKSLMQRFGYM